VSAFRVPTEDDIPQVVRLISDQSPEPADEESVRRSWSSPTFDLELDARIEPDAYARVEDLGNERVWVDLRGRPSQELLDWAELRAGERGERVLSGSWTTNGPILRELERRGFRVVRHSLRMTIDLDGSLDEPAWPEGMTVRCFRPGDERTFYEAHQEAFADTWEPIEEAYEAWAHWVLDAPPFDPELWFLAEQESETAGFAICKVHASDAELGWVFVLGVRRPWRGRGLGRALLLHAFREFRRRGLRRAGLGVDSQSPTGANRLYESVGMSEVARFEVREKVVA
jgi:ribosomal protein S18 acetylase RimI-like enzyme